MIRLPATSIGLSDADLEWHLGQIDQYANLLKGGFTKTQIREYREEVQNRHRDDDERGHSFITVPECDSPPSSVVEPTVQGGDARKRIFGTSNTPRLRHSSLRFVQTASNNSSPPPAEDMSSSFVLEDLPNSPYVRARVYRPGSSTHDLRKSDTYTDSSNHSSPSLSPIPRVGGSRSAFMQHPDFRFSQVQRDAPPATKTSRCPLRPEAAPFTPALPPPFSATRRTSSTHFILPDRTRPLSQESLASGRPSSLTIGTSTPVSSIPHRSMPSLRRPSIPVFTSTDPESLLMSSPPVEDISASLVSPLSAAPSTPHRRSTPHPSHSEPRRHRHTLHASISVYNDQVPSIYQPQTPADLSRQPYVTEHEAAYTAPPGMLGSTSAIRQLYERQHEAPVSPILRSTRIRERIVDGRRREGNPRIRRPRRETSDHTTDE